MSLQADLESAGWHLSQQGIELCCQGLTNPTVKDVIKKALNLDLKEVGSPSLPDDINRGRVESLDGGLVLMVTKIRNVAAPKVKEESGAAPRMLKISLTDGTTTCHAVEMSELKSVSLKTPPGTKIKLKGAKLEVANGFVKISEKNLEVLGGEVEALVEKWKVNQSLAEFTRSGMTGGGGEGPPKWLPFGQKNKMPKQDPNNKNFKSIVAKPSEGGDEGEFECKRQEAVQEAAKGEQKKFAAGSSKNIKDSRARREEREKSDSVEKTDVLVRENVEGSERGGRGGRGGRGRGRGRGRRERGEREEEGDPGQAAPSKPSLFDFLQGQIPNPAVSVPASASTAREERKDSERSKPRGDSHNKYEVQGRTERENNKDLKSRKDQEREKKTGKEISSRKDANQDKKSHPGDKHKEDNRRKENSSDNSERKNKKETKNSNSRNSNSQNKEFNPIFHGKINGSDQPEKLDKYERSLFSEDLGSRSKPLKQNNSSARNQGRSQQPPDFTNHHNKQSNHSSNHHQPQPGGRHGPGGGGDQDFGQWNGSRNPKDLSAGFQNLSLGPHRGGNPAQANRGYVNGHHQQDRHSGGGGGHQRHHDRAHGGPQDRRGGYEGGTRQNWKEGQKCLAKYWEDGQFYTATITGFSPTTAVVRFDAYGNHEEVVLGDLLPLPNKNMPPAFRH